MHLSGIGEWNITEGEQLISSVEIDHRAIPIHWKFSRKLTSPRKLVAVYDSARPRLRLTSEWSAPAAFGPVEHVIRIENLDRREVTLPSQDSFAFRSPTDPGTALDYWYFDKGAGKPSEIGTHHQPLRTGDQWIGFSSTYAHPRENEPHEVIPWFGLENAKGDGWYAGIEFSGRTRLQLIREKGSIFGVVGLNPTPGPFQTHLRSGETFEAPKVFVGSYTGGIDGAGNILRRWVRQVLGNAKAWADPQYPLLVNNSWGSGMQVDEATADRMLRDSAELGLEMFHLDAGWFRGVGDWASDPVKFPSGLAALSDRAHHLGLRFGIWTDWTQAGISTAPGALNVHDPTVRDWLVSDLPSAWKPEPFKGQTIDIGVPAAREYAEKMTSELVKDYRIDMLEHDGYLVTQGCVRSDHPHLPPDPSRTETVKIDGSYFVHSTNSTDVSYYATRAYYAVQQNLRRKYPHLLLEICNDGGRMVDFGSAAHGDYFSITDAYDPVSNRQAFYDTSHLLPPAMLECYVEKWPTPTLANFRYMLRSGMMGWFTLMLDSTAWTPDQHRAAKEEFRRYKSELRPLIRDADLYHLTDRPDGIRWDAIEYFDPKRRKGCVYVFHGSDKKETRHSFRLVGVRSVRLHFYDSAAPDLTTNDGSFEVSLPEPNNSAIVLFEQN